MSLPLASAASAPPSLSSAAARPPPQNQRRSLALWWPFSRPPRLRRRPPLPAAAAAAPQTDSSTTSSSTPSVILPGTTPSTGRALGALGPHRDRHQRLGFGFSAGGLLFPYYVGVAYSLKESGALVPGVTPLAGASAGSLIAACVGTGLGREEVEAACLALADDCRTGGTFGRLGHVLRDFLEENLPRDAHELARGRVHVAVTPLAAAEVAAVAPTRQARVSSEKLLHSLAEQAASAATNGRAPPPASPSSPFKNPFALSPRALLVSDFTSREDLIEALLSSCHIPFWMTGKPTTRFRGGRAVDGGLLNFLPLPPPPPPTPEGGADELDSYHTVGVCCFPSAGTIGARLGPGRLIAPDVFEPLTAEEGASSAAASSGSFDEADLAADAAVPPTPLPALAPNFPTLLGWAFSPTSEENLLALAALGEADARAWASVELGADNAEAKSKEGK